MKKMHRTRFNGFFFFRNQLSLSVHGVLETVLVCAHNSSKTSKFKLQNARHWVVNLMLLKHISSKISMLKMCYVSFKSDNGKPPLFANQLFPSGRNRTTVEVIIFTGDREWQTFAFYEYYPALASS